MPVESDQPGHPDGADFEIARYDVAIPCPHCGNELAHDGNTLVLAESPRGAQFECGRCEAITEWSFRWDPFAATQVPVEHEGSL